MRLDQSSYRDKNGNIVDKIDVEGSHIEELVIIRDTDGNPTVRVKDENGDTNEIPLELQNRQYVGVSSDTAVGVDIEDDVQNVLMSVGFALEPSDMQISE